MATTDPRPGRRRAAPPPRRRSLRTRPPRPARSPRRTRRAGFVPFVLRALWWVALVAALVAVTVSWTAGVPGVAGAAWTSWTALPETPLAGAVALTALYTHALAVRTGGRPLISGGLALGLCAAAAVTGSAVLLAGAAVSTAVVAGILGVLATKPAASFAAVVREVLVATAVAAGGAFAVRAYGAEVSEVRTGYLVIGFSLIGALALVYRLGAGLHGIGRRGAVMIVGGVILLTATLAYTEALAEWGSPGLVTGVERSLRALGQTIGAVPQPIEVLLGFPALAWGVSTRARRRQGWWVCAFAAPGLAVVAISLLPADATVPEAGLTVGYSLVLGLVIGYVVIRADLYLTGARGRRARRLEELAAHRPEPGRFEPLL